MFALPAPTSLPPRGVWLRGNLHNCDKARDRGGGKGGDRRPKTSSKNSQQISCRNATTCMPFRGKRGRESKDHGFGALRDSPWAPRSSLIDQFLGCDDACNPASIPSIEGISKCLTIAKWLLNGLIKCSLLEYQSSSIHIEFKLRNACGACSLHRPNCLELRPT